MYRVLLLPLYVQAVLGFTSSQYALDSEYSGANFFEGWDFFTGVDPTGGFVTYYDRLSAEATSLVNVTANGQVYMGMDYTSVIPTTTGAGRPSIRISTERTWTHGLFIGDFEHAPGGVCATWPAFWTLAPNWPYNGEIDILEGVNLLTQNGMTLHSSTTCLMLGTNATANNTQSGISGDLDCAYYPDDDIGCGVVDQRTNSFGTPFNEIGGGVYAMQWTSGFIKVWFFPRSEIPSDITNLEPNPSSWGIPAANFETNVNCTLDDHFQQHSIVFDNTLCGAYAGVVWDEAEEAPESCATFTGYSDCNTYVAENPAAFKEAYWLINSVRVYQLVDPATGNTDTGSTPYIASEQPAATATASAITPAVPTASLCPTYNFTVISDDVYQYEIECGRNPPGSDLGPPTSSYAGPVTKFEDCVAGCTLWNNRNGSTTCAGVAFNSQGNACYWKSYIYASPWQEGFDGARLLYYGYPYPTDLNTTTDVADDFVQTAVSPQTYLAINITSMPTTTTSTYTTAAGNASIGEPGLGQSVSVNGSAVVVVTDNTTATVSPPPSMGVIGTAASTTTESGLTTTSVAVGIQTGTIPSSTAVSSGEATGLSPSSTSSGLPTYFTNLPFFYITIEVPSAKVVARQAETAEYVAFNQGASYLTTDQSAAALFQNDNGTLVSGGNYVVPGNSPSGPLFSLSPTADNTTVATVSNTGGALSFGNSTICTDANGNTFFSNSTSCPPGAAPASVGPDTVTPSFLTSTSTSPQGATSVTSGAHATSTTSSEGTGLTSLTHAFSVSYPTSTTTSGSNPGSVAQSQGGATTVSVISAVTTVTSTSLAGTATASTISVSTIPGEIDPAIINAFHYVGCRALTPQLSGFTLKANSSGMSAELCASSCASSLAFGLYSSYCYCSNTTSITTSLTTYSEASCNIVCPGNKAEVCGGLAPSTGTEKEKRQLEGVGAILINLYTNPGYGVSVPPTTPAFSTPSSPVLIAATSPPLHPYVVSTVYVDVCSDSPYSMTTLATTVTLLHCGCTESLNDQGSTVPVSPPAVPMTTTVKTCGCGEGGAESSTTVTVPCTSAIEAASSQLAAMTTPPSSLASGAPAAAGAAGVASAGASVGAGAGAGAGATTEARVPAATQPSQVEPASLTGVIAPVPGIAMGNTTAPQSDIAAAGSASSNVSITGGLNPVAATPAGTPVASMARTGGASTDGTLTAFWASIMSLLAVLGVTLMMV